MRKGPRPPSDREWEVVGAEVEEAGGGEAVFISGEFRRALVHWGPKEHIGIEGNGSRDLRGVEDCLSDSYGDPYGTRKGRVRILSAGLCWVPVGGGYWTGPSGARRSSDHAI